MEATFLRLLYQLPPFLLAVCFHEFCHAWMARRFGDSTAERQGRLTLNPISHIDPMGTVIFPLLGLALGGVMFGWAKPVPIDPRNFKSQKPGLFWVSFAGPLGNIILAVLSAISYGLLISKFGPEFYFYRPLEGMLTVSVFINLILAMFNLIPVPPLDGSRMLQVFLSPKHALRFESLSRFGMLILLVLVFSGTTGSILAPAQDLGVFFLKTSLMIFGIQAVGA